MERLKDETLKNAINAYEITLKAIEEHGSDDPDYCPALDKVTFSFLKELKEYRDAEEQGLLLRLPLKKGDVFWELNKLTEPPCCYPRYAHSLSHCVYVLERFGKTVFLTKEEAEAALERMNNNG